MTVEHFLRSATAHLEAAGVTSPRLDAQILVCRALRQNKAWLLAHGEETIDPEKLAALTEQIRRRAAREPLAYIIGWQEFYGRRFTVDSSVLIPRPETEEIIEQLRALPLPDNANVLDVGTGSGAIAITTALELPNLRVQACDVSHHAIEIAEQNADRLGATIVMFISDLLADAHQNYDAVLANLPYVARSWERSAETHYEPELALFAEEDDGMSIIKRLIVQAPTKLTKKGYLLLEADPRQHQSLISFAKENKLKFIAQKDFIVVLQFL